MTGHSERRLERSPVSPRVEGVIHLLREKQEQAERASQNKSRFLAAASHDLRQPIHALGLYIAELRRQISGKEQQYLVRQLERSVDAVSTLVDDLLDISRLDAGAMVPLQQPCDVAQLLDRMVAEFRMPARSKNIRLAVRSFRGFVSSDPVMLERILTNLVSNALRYTHQNGTVLIACRRRGETLQIEVRDNGIGIDPACQAHIFGEFVRLNHPALGGQPGLGLGLSIVDRLVKLLGHALELHSAPGKGSTFSLRLNLSASPVIIEPVELLNLSLSGKKMLVLDSDARMLDGMSKLLRSWGCEVTAASAFKDVQRRLNKGECWDMVISDELFEGHQSGLDVIRMVRQRRETPCILISSRPDELKSVQEAELHALLKPVKPAKLRSLMQFLLMDQTINLND